MNAFRPHAPNPVQARRAHPIRTKHRTQHAIRTKHRTPARPDHSCHAAHNHRYVNCCRVTQLLDRGRSHPLSPDEVAAHTPHTGAYAAGSRRQLGVGDTRCSAATGGRIRA